MKKKLILLLAVVMVLSLVGCQSGDPSTGTPDDAEAPIIVGHLSYHTGPFGHLGPIFDGAADFTLGFVNETPPLGRQIKAVHQDIGTLGEGQIARKLVENENSDILLCVAGEYMSYREWLVDYIAKNNKPLLPSVHAGAVAEQYGGVATEPIFRAAPMDTDMALAAALAAQKEGAKTVVVMAVENDGMQMQKDATILACEALGIEVLRAIDFQPEQTSYRSEVSQAQAANPDALIIWAAGEDGGTVVKNVSELGMSTMVIGDVNFIFEEFIKTATVDGVNSQKFVKVVGFANADNAAFEFFEKEWNASEYAGLESATNSYVMQFYDVLNLTMLAIEKAGSTDTAAWTKAMYEVSMGPGKKVYTYAEGIAALRNGEEIDYDGVTGECNYTGTGVIGANFLIYDWNDAGELVIDYHIEDVDILALGEKMRGN